MPFVLCYTGLDVAELCIDASASGNEMKFIRCSCSPNAKVSCVSHLLHESLSFLLSADFN